MVLGGGQDAMNVTMTDRRAGKFEAKFYHKVSSFLVKMLREINPLFLPFDNFYAHVILDFARGNWWCQRTFWTN